MKTDWIFKSKYELGGHVWVGINSSTETNKPDDIFRFQFKTKTGQGDCDLLLNPIEAMDLCTGLNFVMSKILEEIPRGKWARPVPKSHHKDTKVAQKTAANSRSPKQQKLVKD